MAGEWLAQFAEQYGFKTSATGSVYGKMRDYFISVAEQKDYIVMNITYYADADSRQLINSVNQRLHADSEIGYFQGNAEASVSGVSIRLLNSAGAQSAVFKKLSEYTELAQELGISAVSLPKAEVKTISQKEPVKSEPSPYSNLGRPVDFSRGSFTPPRQTSSPYPPRNTGYQPQNTGCGYTGAMQTNKAYAKPHKAEAYNTGFSSVMSGIGGALLGALIGGIPWILFLEFEIGLLFVAAVLCALGASIGYKKLGGASNRVVMTVIVVLSVILVTVGSEFIIYAVRISDSFNCSVFQAFSLLWAADLYSDIKTRIILNAVYAIISGMTASIVITKHS